MAETKENKYAIHEAAREGRIQVVESLLSANPRLAALVDQDERLPIHWACAFNHLDIVKLLTSTRSFDPDAQDGSGWTPLAIAASLKDNSGEAIIELLLSKEADPKVPTNSGATALHFAVSKGNLEICKTLLKHGASARTKDKRGQLPLHRAAAAGSVPIVKLLLEHKSPINATDMDGMTALHHAISEGNGDVAIELLKAGAETDKKDSDGKLAIEYVPDTKVRSYILKAAEREGIELE
ncbi:putative ankyrin-repeat protein [Elasticomyces elasticus]|uniref:Ankyrin-repeat protein n=1 Tax=Exophiala sideris TaxID=1016849 RepID=A0ABR0JI92_9EURO|nr:putative ankyrin-repeat protein [Elasticomyces elasticus]KAK5034327.1 putative ankyrin-repeat protein [Exophiala sideris]KAK5042624.1 putative ankyrin-repeat protein [Exophiala sideris]KAK5065706.1 putative ankyrin-repeat protein [Exophiala sideris]KAK5185836.1 putative ankyrin-repeat protein [Eurotiomycetes sp. CCFEE 6388]